MLMKSSMSPAKMNQLGLLQLQFKIINLKQCLKTLKHLHLKQLNSVCSDLIKQQKITDLLFSPSVTVKKQEVITESLVKCIAKDMLPLSTVDGVGFLELMRTVSPNYQVPCRNTIKRRILGLY